MRELSARNVTCTDSLLAQVAFFMEKLTKNAYSELLLFSTIEKKKVFLQFITGSLAHGCDINPRDRDGGEKRNLSRCRNK